MPSINVLPFCLLTSTVTEYRSKYGFPDPSLWIVIHNTLFYGQFKKSWSTFMGKGHSGFTQLLNQTSFHYFYFSSFPMTSPFLSKVLRITLACPSLLLVHIPPFLPAPDLTLELRNTLQLMPRDPWLDSNSSLNKNHGKSQLCKQKSTL